MTFQVDRSPPFILRMGKVPRSSSRTREHAVHGRSRTRALTRSQLRTLPRLRKARQVHAREEPLVARLPEPSLVMSTTTTPVTVPLSARPPAPLPAERAPVVNTPQRRRLPPSANRMR
jgi:hypothetical protein